MKSLCLIYFSDNNKFGIYNFLNNFKKNFSSSKIKIELYLKKNLFNPLKLASIYDILYLHGCWNINHLLIFLLAKIKKKKIFLSPHGMLDPGSLSQKKFIKKVAWHLYQKIIFAKSDLIIVNSKLEKKNLNLLNINKNIFIIPHGIEVKKFKILKKKNKIFKIIFFSRIHPIKGLLELVNFWINSKILLDVTKYQLDIYGYAEDKKYLNIIKYIIIRNNIKNINISTNNHYYNKKIIKDYNLLVAPSVSENFSIVVLEALSLKVPVVTSVGMPWKFLENLGLGVTINFNKNTQYKKLFYFIEKIKKKKFKKKFEKKCSQLIKKKYNWLDISKRYNFLFKKFS